VHCDVAYARLIGTTLNGDKITTRNSNCWRTLCSQVEFSTTPLVSLRKTSWKNSLREWEWFMSGSCYLSELHPAVKSWWEPWADENGRIAHNYSQQFRRFYGEKDFVDQIHLLIQGICDHPYSRRNVITTWNKADMNAPECPITNCHGTVIQAFVDPNNQLTLVMYQRSVDVICGLPHNWIQYWAFLLWLAHSTQRQVGKFIWIGGDIHVYEQHLPLALRMITQDPEPIKTPNLVYTPTSAQFKADDFTLDAEYQPLIVERAEMVV